MTFSLYRVSGFLALALTMVGSTGCVDALSGGGTSGTAVYVYDNASQSVLVWNDADTLYSAPTAPPAADKTLTAGDIALCAPLAWGGLAADSSTNCLYLVAANGGLVTRISQVTTQSGAITSTAYIGTFNLGASTDLISGGSFGQANVNASTGILYVAETSADQTITRIWPVPGASTFTGTVPVSSVIAQVPSDRGYTGVAGGSGSTVYGYFTNGSTVSYGLTQQALTGPRLRSGAGVFDPLNLTGVVVGSNTLLADPLTPAPLYGTLAFDSINSLLYVARQTTASATVPAVLAFGTGKFSLGFNQAPTQSLADTGASLPALRFITHAGTKDWLAGADWVAPTLPATAGGTGTNVLHLWKSPSAGGTSVAVELPSAVQIGGVALAGAN